MSIGQNKEKRHDECPHFPCRQVLYVPQL